MSKIKFFLATKGFIVGIIFAGILSLGIFSAFAFGPPAGTIPPNNNVAAPINIGITTQNKGGTTNKSALTLGGQNICLKDGTNCPESMGSPIHFQWILSSESCRSGYVDTGLRDDSNSLQHILDENSKEGNETKLCVKGAVAAWAGSCPGGYFDTGIIDDGDSVHNIGEQVNDGGLLRFCISGISRVEWVGNCRPGWSSAYIEDDDDAVHALYEKQDHIVGGMTLCVQ